MKYFLIAHPNVVEFQNAVQSMLDMGWKLHGSTFVNHGGNFFQAMIKE